MAINSTNRRNDYVGTGSADTYNYNFKIQAAEDLLVIQIDDEGNASQLVLDTHYSVASVGYTTGSITLLNGDLPLDYKLIIIGDREALQNSNIRNRGSFYPNDHETFFDHVIMLIQQILERLSRVVTLPAWIKDTDFDPTLPSDITEGGEDRFLKIKDDGSGFEIGAAGGGGGTGDEIEIGEPTVPHAPEPYNGPLGLTVETLLSDFAQKVDDLFALIVPTPPANLSTKVLTIVGSYLAKFAGTGADHTCTDDTTPEIRVGNYVQGITDGFANANDGTLSAEMDTVEVGSKALTAADDSGTYGEMQIVDFDPYASLDGEGVFKALIARMVSSALSVGQHVVEFIHTLTGATDLEFYVDDPTTPSITGVSLTAPGSSSYKSGVPGVAQGQNINVQYNVTDFVGTHYNPTRIAGAQSPQTGAQVDAALGGPHAFGATFAANINLPVAASAYSENVSVTRKAYNSKGTEVTSAVTNNVRVDTVGTESRNLSSTGQYPASGYTTAFNSTTDVLSGNKELQFLNGQYKYPPAVDYSSKLPAGPNYSALTADAYNSMRWVTIALSALSNASSTTISLANVTGISSVLQSGIEMYLKVEGATGWLDMNAAYPGVGSPSANGDPALVVGSSTATVRVVTFGATPRSGVRYVRIGIPSGSTKAIGGIS